MSHYRKSLSLISISISLALGSSLLPSLALADAQYNTFIWGNGNYGDNVTITGASSGGYQGSAIYKNANNSTPGDRSTGIVVGDNLVASTGSFLRSGADVIMTKAGANVDASIIVGKNAQLTATGISGDGINVGYGSGSMAVIIGEGATITSTQGMGVRANLGDRDSIINLIEIGRGAVITTSYAGNNTNNGAGYGVYAGNRQKSNESGSQEDTVQLGQAIVKIGADSEITTSGANAHGVFANKGGRVVLGDNVTVKTTNTTASSVADALHAEKGTEVNFSSGSIELLGGANLTALGSNSNAISAYGEDAVIHSYDADTASETAGVFNITGNIKADQQARVALNMTDSSIMTGNVNALNQANIGLNMTNGSILTGNLNASTEGAITFALDQASQLHGTVTASGGSIGMTLDGGSQAEGNIVASSQGSVDLTMDNASILTGDLNASTEGAITFALDQASQLHGTVTATGGSIGMTLDGGSQAEGNIVASSQGSVDLTIDNASTLTGNLTTADAGRVALTMNNASVFTGYADAGTDGAVNVSLNSDSVWNMTESSQTSVFSLDGARLNFVAPADVNDPAAFVPKILTVTGDYQGNGGIIAMNTVLGDDNSLSDKLVVEGSTSGTTNMIINNIGGLGAETIQGIEVVSVEGNSGGIFQKLDGTRIVAGSYEYSIVKNGNNWYLSSLREDPGVIDPEPDPDPEPGPGPDPEPGPGPDPEPGVDPGPSPSPDPEPEHVQRPESASYIANLAAANTLFITRLHDRLGETQYTDALTGEKKVTSMWMRNEGGHNRFHDASGQVKTTGNRYVLQIGGDLAQWSNNGQDRWHLGLMAGYANQQSKSRASLTNYSSRGHVSGYSVGLYGTWYANEADKTGLYVDTWALYGWFKNKVSGDALKTEKYDSDGLVASVESGYTFKLGESERNSYWLQPKAQVVWMGVKADEHREHNGTRVRGEGDGNLMTRLGLRATVSGNNQASGDSVRSFQPFVELNWIHNTKEFGVKMNDEKNAMKGAKNIGEVKVGVEGQASKRLNLWGNVGYQAGSNSYSDAQAMVGIKYHF